MLDKKKPQAFGFDLRFHQRKTFSVILNLQSSRSFWFAGHELSMRLDSACVTAFSNANSAILYHALPTLQVEPVLKNHINI